jgi:GT2 family glycosyltransferase/lipopolysaccharide/colanic/teichoic acid biosynthesis glycosyltransferase
MQESLELSIIIVSYNVREFLEQALLSIHKAVKNISHEVFVVDNASSDGSADLIARKFPAVKLARNSMNLGFARANNLAIGQCRGKFICLVNPDTIVQEDTFSVLIDFLRNHPEAGAVGCKILNPDGTLQLACRRSFPTPWVAFTKITGLASLFPRSRLFGRYNLTYLNPEKTSEVEAISGSFMVIRKQAQEQIGLLDEMFFMYGEDLDFCYRLNAAGWKIYYVPATQIIHFKGESSKRSYFEHRLIFYQAMRIYVRKHFRKGRQLFPSWILILAIYLRTVLSFLNGMLRYLAMPLFDTMLMTISLLVAIYIRFYPEEFPWRAFLYVHLFYCFAWLISLMSLGLYSKAKLSAAKASSAIAFGWLVNSTFTYFFKNIAFSRAVVIYAGFLNMLLIPGWRFLFKRLAHSRLSVLNRFFGRSVWSRRTIIVGDLQSLKKLVRRLKARIDNSYDVTGVVVTDADFYESSLEEIPVLGKLEGLSEIVKRERVQEVIFSTDQLPYDKILSSMAASNGASVSFKLVPSNLEVIIGKATTDYLDDIPFVDIEYKLHVNFFRFIKRLLDLVLALVLILLSSPFLIWLRWARQFPLLQKSILGANGKNVYIQSFRDKDVTRPILRKLPFLFSILRGDLSFVGREISSPQNNRLNDLSLSIKPGLTGFEQINKQLLLTDEDRENYHLYYLKNYSPILDIEILFKSLTRQVPAR